MNKKLVFVMLFVAASGLAVYFVFFHKNDNENLINAKFQSFEKVLDSDSSSQGIVDLEETVKTIHALENAQQLSTGMDEYLEYIQSRDYSKVAPDVLAAKKKMIPFLKEVYRIELEMKESDKIWNQLKVLKGVVTHSPAIAGTFAEMNIIGFTSEISKTAIDVFGKIEENEDASKKLKNSLSEVKSAYLDYLEDYSKLYYKYMLEWNKICLVRDRAYLELFSGNPEEALKSANKVLELNPNDREGMLLKSMSLLNSSVNESSLSKDSVEVRPEVPFAYSEAMNTTNNYLELYPEKAAPALLLKGIYYSKIDSMETAFRYFDQSAVEYPKQASYLLDMMDSYESRKYLRQTEEGLYLMDLYISTMEGYGIFSPNFQKAFHYNQAGDFESAKEEIYKHFFRRGNQEKYDHLISDMQYGETYLQPSFSMVFKQKSFMDLDLSTGFFNKNLVKVSINNRSDKALNNVRVFLCIHFTDMYPKDYEVFKMPQTLNKIEPHSEEEVGEMEIYFSLFNKEKTADKDIVHARAIILSDEVIGWVDNKDFRITQMKNDNKSKSAGKLNEINTASSIDYLSLITGMSESALVSVVEDHIKIETVETMMGLGKDQIRISLPSVLSVLDPVFSIYPMDHRLASFPTESEIHGKEIILVFNSPEDTESNFSFYIQSALLNMRLKIKRQESIWLLEQVSLVN